MMPFSPLKSHVFCDKGSRLILSFMEPYCFHCIFMPTKMFKQPFWMCYFQSRTCKRTILWSTGSIIGALKIYKTMRRSEFQFDPQHKTAVAYTNRRGEKAYKGSSELKRSQFPGCIILQWNIFIYSYFYLLHQIHLHRGPSHEQSAKDLHSKICKLFGTNAALFQWLPAQAATTQGNV